VGLGVRIRQQAGSSSRARRSRRSPRPIEPPRSLHSVRQPDLLGAHCTGLEAVYRIRKIACLDRATAVVGAVGSSFTLGRGLDPRRLAR
jgi:hypothetical protein